MFAYVCIILTHLRDRQKSATTQRSLGETGEVNGSSQICRIPAAARRCHVPSNYGQKSKQAHPQRKVELTRIEALAGANLRSNLTIFDYICLRCSLSVTFLIRVHWDSTWQVLLDLLWHRCLIGGKQCPILASKIVQSDQSFYV